ncbi:MAG: gliding motility lipoprotein GldH [Bergeyella sp.]
MTNKILYSFFVLLLLASCTGGSEAVFMNSIDGKWNKKDTLSYEFSVSDVQQPKNIIFVVRNNDEYPYSNLRLIVDFTDLKNKKKQTDTLNYIMAKPNGEWLGKGFGEAKEIQFQYKLNYQFVKDGKYSVKIVQAMRNDNLPGIEDFGIKIESAKP